MKLVHYFLGFVSFTLAYWVFDAVLCSENTVVNNYIVCSLIFGVLATTAIYNLLQGYKLQKKEY